MYILQTKLIFQNNCSRPITETIKNEEKFYCLFQEEKNDGGKKYEWNGLSQHYVTDSLSSSTSVTFWILRTMFSKRTCWTYILHSTLSYLLDPSYHVQQEDLLNLHSTFYIKFGTFWIPLLLKATFYVTSLPRNIEDKEEKDRKKETCQASRNYCISEQFLDYIR